MSPVPHHRAGEIDEYREGGVGRGLGVEEFEVLIDELDGEDGGVSRPFGREAMDRVSERSGEIELGDGGLEGEDRDFTIERVIVGEKNGARLPTYQRLDLSANYEFDLLGGRGTAGLTVFNVGDRDNVWYKEFTSVDGEIFENNILLMSRTYNLFLTVRF